MSSDMRTPNQQAADAFDLQLNRMISAAKRNAEHSRQKGETHMWATVAAKVAQVRPYIRQMMHDMDRERTLPP